MHGDHGPSFRSNGRRDSLGVDIPGLGIDVGENRDCPQMMDDIGGGYESEGSGDNLVSGLHTLDDEGQEKRRSARGQGYTMFGTHIMGYLFLEQLSLFTGGQPTALEGFDHFLDLGLSDRRNGKFQVGFSHANKRNGCNRSCPWDRLWFHPSGPPRSV